MHAHFTSVKIKGKYNYNSQKIGFDSDSAFDTDIVFLA